MRILLATMLLLAGLCSARAAEATVHIDDFSFTPARLVVAPGTEITWTNRDDMPHTVTSQDGTLRSAALDTGDSFSATFTTPGSYAYFCSLHPHMQGTVIVR